MKMKKRKIEIKVCILLISEHVYILTDILIRGVVVVVVAGGCVVLGCNIYILLYIIFLFCS